MTTDRNIKLVLEYDGSDFQGWQKQNGKRTVEEELEKAIMKALDKEEIKIIASGRTDKGVHAYGQVVNFKTKSTIPYTGLKHAINNRLPSDISIRESEEVDINFHSRFNAKKKKYRYVILNKEEGSSIYRKYLYHVKYEMDLVKMEDGLKHILGTHDFSSFVVNRSRMKCNIRTIYGVELREKNSIIEVDIEGNGFLHNMVRIILGTAIEIACGKRKVEDMKKAIANRDRICAGSTVPAYGLYLLKVDY